MKLFIFILSKNYLKLFINSIKKRIFATMKQEVSILIPTYNHRCFPLVKELARQASLLERLRWEIIVAEDGSTDERAIEANAQVNSIAHCRQLVLPGNLGRAAIRNYLASRARHSWLLFIDSDMSISLEDYLLRFLSTKGEVVYGGYHVAEKSNLPCLRYRYERAAERSRELSRRLSRPYHAFRACNFMASGEVMRRYPFDERFSHYGFEETMLAKTFMRHHVPVSHIDAPVDFDCQESNLSFIEKTEEAMRTLHRFETELADMSTLLALARRIERLHLSRPLRFFHHCLGTAMRNALVSKQPPLWQFHLYKLGYLMSIQKRP